jgi:hypothetical protein
MEEITRILPVKSVLFRPLCTMHVNIQFPDSETEYIKNRGNSRIYISC